MTLDLAWWGRLAAFLMAQTALIVGCASLVNYNIRAAQLRRAVWQGTLIALACVWLGETGGLGEKWRTVRVREENRTLPPAGQIAGQIVSVPVRAAATTLPADPPFPLYRSEVAAPVTWPGKVWMLGTLWLLLRIAANRGWLVWRRRQTAFADVASQEMVARLRVALGLGRVEVRTWARLRGPIAFGWWRPTVALPSDFSQRFPPAQQEAMLAHELAHLAARDPGWLLLADLLCGLAWWNPLVWWAAAQLRAASEEAADEASALVPSGPAALAESLLRFGRELAESGPVRGLGVAGRGFRSGLGRRINKLLTTPERWRKLPAHWRWSPRILAVIIVLTLTSLPVVTRPSGSVIALLVSSAQAGAGAPVEATNQISVETRAREFMMGGEEGGPPRGVRSSDEISLKIRCTKGVVKVGDEIPIEFIISNLGKNDWLFDTGVGEPRVGKFGYQLSVKKKNGDPLPNLIPDLDENLWGRQFVLHPGEYFTKIIILNRRALLQEAGQYEVRATYRGEYNTGANFVEVSSAPLALAVLSRSDAELPAQARSGGQSGDPPKETTPTADNAAYIAAPSPVATVTGQSPVMESKPAEKAGLSVVIQPAKDTFAATEPLVLQVSFRNVSKESFRLPDQVNPARYGVWGLKLEDVKTGKTYLGVTMLPGGAAPEPGEIRPVAIKPDEHLITTAAFQRFGFIAGQTNFRAAENALFHLGMEARRNGNPASYPPPPGTYKLSVNVGFRSFPDRPNVPDRIRAARAAIENDPIPLWPGKEILSNPVEITITEPAAREIEVRETSSWGPVTKGLQMSMSVATPVNPDNPEFDIAFRNTGGEDVSLNLGIMLANGKSLFPTKIHIHILDASGADREFHFHSPNISGRADDYVMPLKAGSTYSLKLTGRDFWSPSTKDYELSLKPGGYVLSAQFQDDGNQAMNRDTKLMKLWKGELHSNAVEMQE